MSLLKGLIYFFVNKYLGGVAVGGVSVLIIIGVIWAGLSNIAPEALKNAEGMTVKALEKGFYYAQKGAEVYIENRPVEFSYFAWETQLRIAHKNDDINHIILILNAKDFNAGIRDFLINFYPKYKNFVMDAEAEAKITNMVVSEIDG